MKIRTGFVSNSSSSSFCLFGIEVTGAEIISAFKDELKKDPKKGMDYINNPEDINAYELLENLEHGLEFAADTEADSYYIGKSPADLKDNETGKHFKTSILEALHKNGFKDVKYADITLNAGEVYN